MSSMFRYWEPNPNVNAPARPPPHATGRGRAARGRCVAPFARTEQEEALMLSPTRNPSRRRLMCFWMGLCAV